MKTTKIIGKGPQMEETLRRYFLDMGYYVVRNVKYVFQGVDVTDVDLWLYQRASLFRRLRLTVDVKNRRIPQALERLLWSKGLLSGLALDGAIVATTDSREQVKQFAKRQNLILLDGEFLAKLKKRYGDDEQRISEEELHSKIRSSKSDRIGVDWLDRLIAAKSRVLSDLNFDGCNALLNDARYFVEQAIATSNRTEAAVRSLYLVISLSLICLDFICLDSAVEEKPEQLKRLIEGLRFGTAGAQGAKRIVTQAAKLLAAYGGTRERQREFTEMWDEQVKQLPVEIIAEFVVKNGQGRALFDLARSFECSAFAREIVKPSDLPTDQKSFLGALLDFFGIDRKQFFEIHIVPASAPTKNKPPPENVVPETKTR